MKYLLTIIIALTLNSTYGQNLTLTSDSDTVFWYNWRQGLADEIGLERIVRSSKEYEFRFWDGFKVVHLWKENGKLEGTVFFFLREYNEEEREKGRLYHSRLTLDDRTVTSIQHLIEDFKIEALPTDKKINGWSQGYDGITYVTEVKNESNYSFKTYWTPTAQNELKEARFFQYFVNELAKVSSIEGSFKKFMDKQPFDSYYAGIGSASIAITLK